MKQRVCQKGVHVKVKRHMINQWIEIDALEGSFDAFEMRLLLKQVEGVLRLEMPLDDNPSVYRFLIEGTQVFSDWLVNLSPDQQTLIAALHRIVDAYYKLCNYMLCSERICLDMETIFVDQHGGVQLLYFPEQKNPTHQTISYNNSTSNRFCKLLNDVYAKYPLDILAPQMRNELLETLLGNHFIKQHLGAAGFIESHDNLPKSDECQGVNSDVSDGRPSQLEKRKYNSKVIKVLGLQVGLLIIYVLGHKVFLQITGDMTEALYGWLFIVLGIDVLFSSRIYANKTKGAIINQESNFCVNSKEPSHVEETIRDPSHIESETTLLDACKATGNLCKANEMLMKIPKYVFKKGSEVIYCFSGSDVLVGRNSQIVQWLIEEPSIGRAHARLWVVDERIFLEDNQSKNGTFVNGVDISKLGAVQLQKGDVVAFSGSEFTLDELSEA